MADVDSIYRASSDLQEAVTFLQETLHMAYAAVPEGGKTPSWLFVLASLADQVDAKAQAYMLAVHQQAMPIVKDFEKARGGMGAVAPMLTKVLASNSANSRN